MSELRAQNPILLVDFFLYMFYGVFEHALLDFIKDNPLILNFPKAILKD